LQTAIPDVIGRLQSDHLGLCGCFGDRNANVANILRLGGILQKNTESMSHRAIWLSLEQSCSWAHKRVSGCPRRNQAEIADLKEIFGAPNHRGYRSQNLRSHVRDC